MKQEKLIHSCAAWYRYRGPGVGDHFTLSPSFCARVGVPQGSCIYPTLFNFFVCTFPQSNDLLTSSYADDFTVFCSNSNVGQMAEALSAHAPNIDEWADERGLAISVPNPSSFYPPLYLYNLLSPILKSIWTTQYYHWKEISVTSILTSNSMPMSNL